MGDIEEIGRLILTQDNRATSDPMFIVQQKRRIHGVEIGYTDQFVWHNMEEDFREAEPNEAESLSDRLDRMEAIPEHWHRIGYVDIWEFVTACFTEKGCKDYLAANGHNLNEPRIYVASAYRNREFNAVRKFLAEATMGKAEKVAAEWTPPGLNYDPEHCRQHRESFAAGYRVAESENERLRKMVVLLYNYADDHAEDPPTLNDEDQKLMDEAEVIASEAGSEGDDE